jgi:hypothetical protein
LRGRIPFWLARRETAHTIVCAGTGLHGKTPDGAFLRSLLSTGRAGRLRHPKTGKIAAGDVLFRLL